MECLPRVSLGRKRTSVSFPVSANTQRSGSLPPRAESSHSQPLGDLDHHSVTCGSRIHTRSADRPDGMGLLPDARPFARHSMQRRHSVHLQRFDYAVEDQADPDRGDKEADDARRGIDPHRTDFLRKPVGIGQARIGDEHRCHDRGRNGDERRDFRANGSLIVEVIPIIVAIAPGPNMSGIARGTKAILASPAPASGTPKPSPDFLGMNSSNPILIRMIPPTTRTMLSGTPNSRSMKLPKTKKKKQSNSA